jgi:transcriptional regulator GlxA family with amidase domain
VARRPRLRPATAPRRILIVAAAGAEILDVVGPFQVFVTANRFGCGPNGAHRDLYRTELIACTRGTELVTNCGLRMFAQRSFHDVRGEIDTLLVAGGDAIEQGLTSAACVRWLRTAATRARRVGSVCTGALLLGRAGLLNQRRVTTHWDWCDRLARACPSATVDPDPIFVRDGKISTSAGVTAGMDLALALVEEDHGAALALQVARHLVLYLRRPGGQAQFSAALALQLAERQPLRELHGWVLEHLSEPLGVADLAAHVHMSPRNFARVFARELRTTPGKFVERLRVETARRRLEETRRSLKQIARECGFGSVSSMRSVFQRTVGIPPARYRQHFRSAR